MSDVSRRVSQRQLKKYGDVIAMWASRYDTAEIAALTKLPEWLVARWVVNYREIMRGVAA